jgi:hypothetical protein
MLIFLGHTSAIFQGDVIAYVLATSLIFMVMCVRGCYIVTYLLGWYFMQDILKQHFVNLFMQDILKHAICGLNVIFSTNSDLYITNLNFTCKQLSISNRTRKISKRTTIM